MLPACFFPPSFQQLSLVLGGLEEMEGYPEAAGVFAEAQIEPSAEGVFPGPLAAGIRQDTPRGCLRRLAAADFDPARARARRRRAWPGRRVQALARSTGAPARAASPEGLGARAAPVRPPPCWARRSRAGRPGRRRRRSPRPGPAGTAVRGGP